jgi:hypothetical protein
VPQGFYGEIADQDMEKIFLHNNGATNKLLMRNLNEGNFLWAEWVLYDCIRV